MSVSFSDTLDTLCINTIRTLAMDAVQKANSGHPGAPMGLAPAAYVLFTRFLKHNPRNPAWNDRDRFVLSAGHASTLLYSLLHLTGYDLSLDDLKQFRQWQSKTPGHPEYRCTPGVETTTGPLGQGFANAVGMAIAERFLASHFNRPGHPVVDHHTYVLCGDGDMMEGIASEAASLAGHLGLCRLVCLYDSNRISIEGGTDMAFTEDVALRFEAYRWNVLHVEDGNDVAAIDQALRQAREELERPSLIVLRTHIGFGSPHRQDSAKAHGEPLGQEEVRLTKRNLNWPEDLSFHVPAEAVEFFARCMDAGKQAEALWEERFSAYANAFPDLARQWNILMSGSLPPSWDRDLPVFPPDTPVATRVASGTVLNALAHHLPTLVGGSADLAPSTMTLISGSGDLQKHSYTHRNLRFGVREHAMGGILSGMALHGAIRPYGATFLVFSDYMRPSIRLAALMELPVLYIFTHDSIAVGEDGPTHQPVEHLLALRAIPRLTVMRPADATETVQAWRQAILHTQGPVALILSRQKLPVIDRRRYAPAEGLADGAYVLVDTKPEPQIILVASGSEVHPALEAAWKLDEKGYGVRVVSMPSWELFEAAPVTYRQRVLPPHLERRVIVEAGSPIGWERYAGPGGKILGMETFGASAPGATLMEKFGFTAQEVEKAALSLLQTPT